MQPRLLLDTHVLVRWLFEAKRLSREQSKLLEAAVNRTEPVAFSAVSLLEVAVLMAAGRLRLGVGLDVFFDDLRANPVFRMLPLDYDVAAEAALLSVLKDPADRAIVATARVHRLRLLTSDERIVASELVATVD